LFPFIAHPAHPVPPPSPTRRSSDLTAALSPELDAMVAAYEHKYGHPPSKRTRWLMDQQAADKTRRPKSAARKIHGTSGSDADEADRKSTRLNSSHQIISYAAFCLKK